MSVFFFKRKTANGFHRSDWCSEVCSCGVSGVVGGGEGGVRGVVVWVVLGVAEAMS